VIEAIVRGIPVICHVPQTQLYNDLLYGLEVPHAFRCYNSAEFGRLLSKIMSFSHEERGFFVKEGKKLRSLYFTPFSEETSMPFLPKDLLCQ
jgi:hypothetical protein